MKRLIFFAIFAILASSGGCNFCRTFCPQQQPQPAYQQVYAAPSCAPIESCCSPAGTVVVPQGAPR